MCYSIKCRTPKREGDTTVKRLSDKFLCSVGYYRAGPALEGTACGDGFWCRAGKCVKNVKPAVDGSADPGVRFKDVLPNIDDVTIRLGQNGRKVHVNLAALKIV